MPRKCGELRPGQGELALPGAVILQLSPARPVDAAPKGAGAGGVSPAAAVGKAPVVPGDRKGGQRLPGVQTLESPGGGMIHPGPAAEPPLKGVGVLSDVVGHARQAALLPCIKCGRERGTQIRGARQMLENGLLPPVLREMRQIFVCDHPVTASCQFGEWHSFPVPIYHVAGRNTRRRPKAAYL